MQIDRSTLLHMPSGTFDPPVLAFTKNFTSAKVDLQFLCRIDLKIWGICTYRVMNPHQ